MGWLRWEDTRSHPTLSPAETMATLYNYFAPAVIVDHRVQLTVSYDKGGKLSRRERACCHGPTWTFPTPHPPRRTH